jgi:peptide chain release factor
MINKYSDLLLSCDVQTFRAGGKGGQHQNKTESAVRVVHLPTGITAVCRDERSQHLNKITCLEILHRKLAKLSEKPKPRIATSISQAQKTKRRAKKRSQAQKKTLRKKPSLDE